MSMTVGKMMINYVKYKKITSSAELTQPLLETKVEN